MFFFFTLILLSGILNLIPSLKKIQVESKETIYAHRNQVVTIPIQLYNLRPNLLPIVCLEVVFPEGNKPRQSFYFYTGKNQELTLEWQPLRRGLYDTLTIELHSKDFFQLFNKKRQAQLDQKILVLPEIQPQAFQLIPFFDRQQQASNFGETNFATRNYREYQPGDSLKYVDWKISSKQATLIYREQEREAVQELTLVFWGQATADFEESLSWYYSIQETLLRKKSFQQILIGQEVVSGEALMEEDFARIQPFSHVPELPEIRNRQIVIVTGQLMEDLSNYMNQLQTTNQLTVLDLATIQQTIQPFSTERRRSEWKS